MAYIAKEQTTTHRGVMMIDKIRAGASPIVHMPKHRDERIAEEACRFQNQEFFLNKSEYVPPHLTKVKTYVKPTNGNIIAHSTEPSPQPIRNPLRPEPFTDQFIARIHEPVVEKEREREMHQRLFATKTSMSDKFSPQPTEKLHKMMHHEQRKAGEKPIFGFKGMGNEASEIRGKRFIGNEDSDVFNVKKKIVYNPKVGTKRVADHGYHVETMGKSLHYEDGTDPNSFQKREIRHRRPHSLPPLETPPPYHTWDNNNDRSMSSLGVQSATKLAGVMEQRKHYVAVDHHNSNSHESRMLPSEYMDQRY